MLDTKDLETLRYTLMGIDSFPYCFYGLYSRFGMGVSIDGKLQIALAKTTEEGAAMKGKSAKGTVKYDSENQLYFTLTPNECYHLLQNLNLVIGGKYENPDGDPKFKNIFSFTHFNNDNKPSHLIFAPDKKDDKTTGALKVTIVPVSGKENSVSFLLNSNPSKKVYERDIFINFLKNVTNSGVYDIMMIKTAAKIYREAFRLKIENDKNYAESKGNKGSSEKSYSKPVVEDVTGLGTSNHDSYNYKDSSDVADITGVNDMDPNDDIPF